MISQLPRTDRLLSKAYKTLQDADNHVCRHHIAATKYNNRGKALEALHVDIIHQARAIQLPHPLSMNYPGPGELKTPHLNRNGLRRTSYSFSKILNTSASLCRVNAVPTIFPMTKADANSLNPNYSYYSP